MTSSEIANAPSPPAAPPAPRKRSPWLAPLRWILVPVKAALRPFLFRVSADGNKVTFTSYSALAYTWFLVPLALVLHTLHAWGWVSPEALGWVQLGAILVLIILLGDDMGLWALAITALLAALLALSARLLQSEYDLGVFQWAGDLLTDLEVAYSPGLGRALALFSFLILSFYVLPKAWFVGRYEITTREITHIRRGVAVESWRRAGRDVKQRWPDLLEMVVGLGAGGIYLLDRQQKAVMSVPHVVCLWFYRREVDRVLETLATTTYEEEEEDVDEAE